MARPKKNNAEYFTHDADMRNDVKIKALRRKFSHTGYAVWNYLLETLTDSDFFEVEWEEINIELLAADYDVSVSELTEIVEYCVKIGLLQRAGNKLISKAHQQRFSSLLANRERKRISEGQNASMPNNGGVMASQNPVKTDETDASGNPKQHSKGEESKGEEKKGEIKYPYQDIADLWNSICKSLPKISKLSDPRRAKIKARLNEFGKPESWMPTCEALFEAVEASSFLRGETNRIGKRRSIGCSATARTGLRSWRATTPTKASNTKPVPPPSAVMSASRTDAGRMGRERLQSR